VIPSYACRLDEPGALKRFADLMRHLLATVINALLSADADAVCGAECGVVSPDRVKYRNGYRHRGSWRPGRHERCGDRKPRTRS
jgi:transposase-like protein